MTTLSHYATALLLALFVAAPPVVYAQWTDGPPRLVIQPGGILDNQTGLIWSRCALGMEADSSDCFGTPRRFSYAEALEAVKSIQKAAGAEWRLPSAEELTTLIAPSNQHLIEDDVFSFLDHDDCYYYWSASSFKPLSDTTDTYHVMVSFTFDGLVKDHLRPANDNERTYACVMVVRHK